MSLTLTTIRAHARTYFDLDATDLPDVLIDAWSLDAFRRIIRSTRNWSHLETIGSLAVQVGVNLYPMPLETITAIEVSSRLLTWMSELEIARRRTGGTSSSDALYFTTIGTNLHIWPTPSTAATAVVYGSRAPIITWMTAPTTTLDLPDDYDSVLLSWVLCETAKQQNDFTAAAGFASDFAVKLGEINASYHASPNAQPLVVNGGSRYRPKYDYAFDVNTAGLTK